MSLCMSVHSDVIIWIVWHILVYFVVYFLHVDFLNIQLHCVSSVPLFCCFVCVVFSSFGYFWDFSIDFSFVVNQKLQRPTSAKGSRRHQSRGK